MVGGGLSGLFTATELVASGVDDLVVLERSPRPGGVAQTIERDGFMLEPAAGSVSLPHPHLTPIFDRIAAEMTVAKPAAATRYVYVDRQLVEIPPSPRALLAPVIPWRSKLRALGEPLVKRAPGLVEESLEGFCRRRFGSQAGSLIAWLMASGVYGGDPEQLSARSAFPMLTGLEDKHGSVVVGALRHRRESSPATPPRAYVAVGGMARLARTAADLLGERFRTGFEVESVRRDGGEWVVSGKETMHADDVVIAAHPAQAARLLDVEMALPLSRVGSAPVVVVGLGGTDGSIPAGFGVLIGPEESLISLGMLFESSYAPHRAPEGSWLIKVIAGGPTRPEIVEWDEGHLVERIREDVALILGNGLEPSFTEVVRHRPGIPQPELGHADWLAGINALLIDRPGLHLTGWGYHGVGLTNLATDAVRVAAAVSGR